MTEFSRGKVVFKRTILAVVTSLYAGATAYAADVERKHTFHVPSFTAQDVIQYNNDKAQSLEESRELLGDVRMGEVNRVFKQRSPEQIFQVEDGVSGVQTYIVQLTEQPVSVYDGHIQGLESTRVTSKGNFVADSKLNLTTKKSQDYQNFLFSKQDDFLASVKSVGVNLDVNKRFTLATNAMVIEMTQNDAILMSKQSGVLNITPNRVLELNTDRGPQFIGADKAWSGEVTPDGMAVNGEGMIIGIIDTGINSDHPSFASDEQYTTVRGDDAGVFYGDCAVDFPELCNDKLIGVRSYAEITEANNFPASGSWRDKKPENGEDYNGHGSHTASTAGGNTLTNIPLQAADGSAISDGIDLPFEFAQVSGVAPRAHIISYQICWPGAYGDAYSGCPTSAILSAYEDAIIDGVDAINMSVGGGERFSWDDPIELALLSAREAGISVAVSAGNSGPNYWSAGHTSPWVTTVGASTHDRVLDTGNKSMDSFAAGGLPSYKIPQAIAGKSFSGAITGKLVLAEDFADPNPNDGFDAGLCAASFPAGTFTADQIVLCNRGENARVEKAQFVADGGAGGFVLLNAQAVWNGPAVATNVVADAFAIPGIHIANSYNNDSKLKTWARTSTDTTLTISDYTDTYELVAEKGNNLATFSSMGPSQYHNTLVPDVTAPGVDIYAAYADEQPFKAYPDARDWTMLQGTSMASPHVAGALTLLKQMHPNWTPAQIQSALMLTANDVYLETWGGRILPFYNFMAGAGAIDVAKAAKAGLIMDESIENYRNANPENGGVANWLNIASMVDMDCENSCSFMRTVTATQDGTWDAMAVTNGVGADAGHTLAVSPSQFTLKAGESKDILVTATMPSSQEFIIEPQDPGSPWIMDNNYSILNGQLILTEINNAAPASRMPIVMASVRDQLPANIDIEINRNQGSETVWVNTDDYSEFTARSFGLVKPDVETVTVSGTRSQSLSHRNVTGAGWSTYTIEVPEGTKQLVVETLSAEAQSTTIDANGKYTSFRPWLMVGLDSNDNGGFVPSEDNQEIAAEHFAERVCISTSQSIHNHCYINNPLPGTYWVSTFGFSQMNEWRDQPFDIEVGTAIITDDSDMGNLTITGPESHDGNGNYPIEISWDLNGAEQGDLFFGGLDMGNMPGAEGTLGFTGVKLARGVDTISMNVSQDKARNMDVIDFSIQVLPNMESADRAYDISMTMPEGMRIAYGTVETNNEAVEAALTIGDNGFNISGTQLSSRYTEAEYVVTTNLTSEQCHTPLIDDKSDGGYIDFADFNMPPNQTWYEGNYKANNYSGFDVPMWWLTQGMQNNDFDIYNEKSMGFMNLSPTGAYKMHDRYWSMRNVSHINNLFHALAPMWVGSFEAEFYKSIYWDNGAEVKDYRGLTIAGQYKSERPDIGDMLFMEFDDIKDTDTGEVFDYEMIIRAGVDDHEGMHEIIYAYDNLGTLPTNGVIGVSGFKSDWFVNTGASEGMISEMLAYGAMDDVLQDDLVICFDYKGPEQSAMTINFKAVIQPEVVGTDAVINLEYSMDGQDDAVVTHTITVNGNIKMGELADMTVAEDGRIDGIEVAHIDANKVANELVVTGENFTVEVDGMTFNLVPDANFSGETEVFVTVRDTEHSGDAATKSFMLTVTAENDAPVVTAITDTVYINEGETATVEATATDVDGDELTYIWSGAGTLSAAKSANTEVSGLAVGSHEFSVSISDGNVSVTKTVTVEVNALPVAMVAEAAITITEGDIVTLDASSSSDADSTLTFLWEGEGNISSANSAITEVSDLTAGDYIFTVTVTDGMATANKQLSVTVEAKPTAAPVVEDVEEDSGGSFGWMLLFALPLMVRRKKMH